MKFFRRYLFPGLYGLLNYFTIRLLQDTESGFRFWHRGWLQNILEIGLSIVIGFAGIKMFNYLLMYFDVKWPLQFHYSTITRELLIFTGLNLVLMNAVFTPLAAFTDDGLSISDFVNINLIPTLYAIVYYGIARSSTYLKAYIEHKLKLEKITNDHLESELKFLKAQYHPHFMFNALNTIYFQMDEDVAAAKKNIEQFSELLRYQLYDQQQKVSVRQEIQYLQNFIELQKVRSSDRLKLVTEIDEKLIDQLVYPLLFLPFVENAFKYVGGDYRMKIIAGIDDEKLSFEVINSIPAFKGDTPAGGGIGLENLKRRLELLYPLMHTFTVTATATDFTAKITLNYA